MTSKNERHEPEIFCDGPQSWSAFRNEVIPGNVLARRARYFVFNTLGIIVKVCTKQKYPSNTRTFLCTCSICETTSKDDRWKIVFDRVNSSSWKLNADYSIDHSNKIYEIQNARYLANFPPFQHFILNQVYKLQTKRPTSIHDRSGWTDRKIIEAFLRENVNVSLVSSTPNKRDRMVAYARRAIIAFYSKKLRIPVQHRRAHCRLISQFENRCEGHPDIRSFLVKGVFNKKQGKRLIDFIRRQFEKNFIDKMVMPIKPLLNSVRLNLRSPQAMRMFFAKTPEKNCVETSDSSIDAAIDKNYISTRYFYGEKGIFTTTAPDPRLFTVFGIENNKCLEDILCIVSEEVKKSLKLKYGWEGELDFNSIELKFYFGSNVCEGITGLDKQPWKCNNNKKIGIHADCRFSEDGQQAPTDTADGNHPIATVSVGGTRKLSFFSEKKERNRTLGETPPLLTTFELDHNSLFILMSWEDEVFKEQKDQSFRRVKHSAKFNGQDFSVAMVFRHVKKENVGLFGTQSGAWLYSNESINAYPTARTLLDNHKRAFDDFQETIKDYEHRKNLHKVSKRLVLMTTKI